MFEIQGSFNTGK